MCLLFFLLISWGFISAMEDSSHLPTVQLDNCQVIYMKKTCARRIKLNTIFNQEFPLDTAFCKVKIRNKNNWSAIQFPKYIPYDLLEKVDDNNLLTLKIADFSVTLRCIESQYQKIDFKTLLKSSYKHFLLHVNFDPNDQEELEKNGIIRKKEPKELSDQGAIKYIHGPKGIKPERTK